METNNDQEITISKKGEMLMLAVFLWLLAAAVFIIIEIVTLGLTSIWFAGGAIVAAVAAAFDTDILIQLILFAIVSVVLLILQDQWQRSI